MNTTPFISNGPSYPCNAWTTPFAAHTLELPKSDTRLACGCCSLCRRHGDGEGTGVPRVRRALQSPHHPVPAVPDDRHGGHNGTHHSCREPRSVCSPHFSVTTLTKWTSLAHRWTSGAHKHTCTHARMHSCTPTLAPSPSPISSCRLPHKPSSRCPVQPCPHDVSTVSGW